MLRILLISLFVANLLLFGFQRNNPDVEVEAPVASTVKKNSDIPTIHLFGEMMQDQGLLTGNRQCFSLGPFHSSDDKDKVRLLLEEVSTRIDERQTEALVEKGYWVFMPPYDSVLEANQGLISLRALGLKDIGIIYDGEWKYAISLGYFMRQENAQRRKKSVESRGHAPLMRVQRQGEPRYWLDYEQTPGSGLVALDMQDRPNDFMQRSLPCPVEDMVELPGAGSQQPAQVVAELQIPEDDNEPVSDSNEDLPQEQLEALPVEAIETETEDTIGTGSADTTETESEKTAGAGQEDGIEAEPENAAGDGQEDSTETEPENAAGTGQEDNIETEPENAVENVQEDAIDTEPKNAVGTGPLDTIDIGPGSAVESGLEDDLETGQEPTVETGPDDTSETGTGEG